jgi:hypothetical protein
VSHGQDQGPNALLVETLLGLQVGHELYDLLPQLMLLD